MLPPGTAAAPPVTALHAAGDRLDRLDSHARELAAASGLPRSRNARSGRDAVRDEPSPYSSAPCSLPAGKKQRKADSARDLTANLPVDAFIACKVEHDAGPAVMPSTADVFESTQHHPPGLMTTLRRLSAGASGNVRPAETRKASGGELLKASSSLPSTLRSSGDVGSSLATAAYLGPVSFSGSGGWVASLPSDSQRQQASVAAVGQVAAPQRASSADHLRVTNDLLNQQLRGQSITGPVGPYKTPTSPFADVPAHAPAAPSQDRQLPPGFPGLPLVPSQTLQGLDPAVVHQARQLQHLLALLQLPPPQSGATAASGAAPGWSSGVHMSPVNMTVLKRVLEDILSLEQEVSKWSHHYVNSVETCNVWCVVTMHKNSPA